MGSARSGRERLGAVGAVGTSFIVPRQRGICLELAWLWLWLWPVAVGCGCGPVGQAVAVSVAVAVAVARMRPGRDQEEVRRRPG